MTPTVITQADKALARNFAGPDRLTRGDVKSGREVRVLGDARFAGNDEPDTPAPMTNKARMRLQEEIREDLRKVGIRTESELLEMLQCVHAATGPFAIERKETLIELCADLEDDINAPPAEVPEPYSGRERGELDSRTAGVKGRAA